MNEEEVYAQRLKEAAAYIRATAIWSSKQSQTMPVYLDPATWGLVLGAIDTALEIDAAFAKDKGDS